MKKTFCFRDEKKFFYFVVLFFFVSFLFVNLVSAVSNLDIPLPTSLGNSFGTYRVRTDISLLQTCTNLTAPCDFCNITSLNYPNGSIIAGNIPMSKNIVLFNYTLDKEFTGVLGKYTVTGFCVGGGVYSPWAYNFEITPSGKGDTNSNIAFFIIVIALVYGIAFIGLFGRNIPMTIMGGMAMLFLGIYLFNNGIIIFRDDLTRYLSYVTIGIGAILAIWASYEWYKEM